MFCSITDLEIFLQLAIPTANHPSANRAIAEATAAIQGYCHQRIERVIRETITLDCAGGTRVFLPELPVLYVHWVHEDGVLLTVTDDYKLGQYGILHRIESDWRRGIQIIEVNYSHGYGTLPDTVVAVATRAASRAYQAGLRAAEMGGIPGVSSTSLGDYSVAFGAEGGAAGEGVLGASAAPILLQSEKRELDRYRV